MKLPKLTGIRFLDELILIFGNAQRGWAEARSLTGSVKRYHPLRSQI